MTTKTEAEKALDEREAALTAREKELDKREKALPKEKDAVEEDLTPTPTQAEMDAIKSGVYNTRDAKAG